VWRRLGRNPLSRVGALVITGLVAVAILAPILATQDPRAVSGPLATQWYPSPAELRDRFARES
jgi:hypothetical protein